MSNNEQLDPPITSDQTTVSCFEIILLAAAYARAQTQKGLQIAYELAAAQKGGRRISAWKKWLIHRKTMEQFNKRDVHRPVCGDIVFYNTAEDQSVFDHVALAAGDSPNHVPMVYSFVSVNEHTVTQIGFMPINRVYQKQRLEEVPPPGPGFPRNRNTSRDERSDVLPVGCLRLQPGSEVIITFGAPTW